MILHALLQRLYASLDRGPSMNARPHRSRHRCDLMDLAGFGSTGPASAVATLLDAGQIEFPARIPAFHPEKEDGSPGREKALTPEQTAARDAAQTQAALLKKLRDIAEEATNYVNDHGESCLALGFPLLSLPADETGSGGTGRVLAPLLLMPLILRVRTTSRPGVTLECAAEGADRLIPNPALLAWLERKTGKTAGGSGTDPDGTDPWGEIAGCLRLISELTAMDPPAAFTAESLLAPVPPANELPRTAAVLPSAVLGLFPLSNQALLRDTRWMIENQESLIEPAAAFLSPQSLQGDETAPAREEPPSPAPRHFSSEWLISSADPCQAAAVLAAREAKALVIHGPPGTGKSQTITNIIADHLARRQRVLFVCDKRTALDVVKYRLDAAGLGGFCGIVHDPGGDRKDFYLGLRTQLENLVDTPVPPDPAPELHRVNSQLTAMHQELENCRRLLHGHPEGKTESFHDLLGTWLDLSARPELPVIPASPEVTAGDISAAQATLDEIARRAAAAGYGANPLRNLHTTSLTDILSRSPEDIRLTMKAIGAAARSADAARPEGDLLDASLPFAEQAARRRPVPALLRRVAEAANRSVVARALALPEKSRQALAAEVAAALPGAAALNHEPLDRGLLTSARTAGILNLPAANLHFAALAAWDGVSGSFFKRLFARDLRKAARAALAPLGLTLANGTRDALRFYRAAAARLQLADLAARITGTPAGLPEDWELEEILETAHHTWTARTAWHAVCGTTESPLADAGATRLAADRLEAGAAWAGALAKLQTLIATSGLFRAGADAGMAAAWAAGEPAAVRADAWTDHAATLEDMVRLGAAFDQLPPGLHRSAEALAECGTPSEEMQATLTRLAAENELRARLQSDPALLAVDGDRIEAAFQTFFTLSRQKLELVKAAIHRTWLVHQRARLLSGTGTQLNSHGAALRQRLFVRGKRALKLRQMLATGEDTGGGDPLYDLCPVWMASPSTVARIFPRLPLFDVVIFDEASQCRLEEALPVLLRGHRVVIAGDQKQLPPTRFFESSMADSGDSDAETAGELFIQQQSGAEDLLTAALNLDVREACLDVHYRSKNEALIGFSNTQYYNSRLQPIPGHPRNKALATPIQLHRVDGIYEDRGNLKEAAAAASLVAELLDSADPPSIGLACFNLTQRDAILDALEAKSEADPAFAPRLAAARKRQGRDSFEGLFVKNLENVQGDERDIMIISTTFGPDAQGKFRRNFGVLSQTDGGRRLNVLVTRARLAVHVLTSIPAAESAALEPAESGTAPNGRLQLYAYLRYAESVTREVAAWHDALERMKRDTCPELNILPSATPSKLAEAIGQSLLTGKNIGSHVHWGNDGFSVDVAGIHPRMPADVTVGILADFSRFHKTPDPVEWDLFRTRILREQGWELQRVWSPVLFRKSEDVLSRIAGRHQEIAGRPAPAAGPV